MKPVAALASPCPCGSGRNSSCCCDAPPPTGADALVRWAEDLCVFDQLSTLSAVCLGRLGDAAHEVPPWIPGRFTVGDLAASAELAQLVKVKAIRPFREAARAFLQEEVKSVRDAIAAEAIAQPEPVDPTLRQLAGRLVALRSALRKDAAPRSLDRVGPYQLRVEAEARRITYREERMVRSEASHAPVEPTVVLGVASAPGASLPAPRCSCGADRPCTHAIAAIDAALAAMLDPARGEWAELVRALEEPDWSRALRALEQAEAARRARLAQPRHLLVSFGVGLTPGGTLEITPYLEKKRGRGLVRKRAAPRKLSADPARIAPEDRAALESLGYLSSSYPYYQPAGTGRRAEVLEKLVGHPRVFLDDGEGAPVSVRSASIGLALRRRPDGALELGPTVGGEPVAAEGLLATLKPLRPGACFAMFDPKRRAFRVVRVEAPDDLRPVLAALVTFGPSFPAEAEARLADHLAVLGEALPLEVPAELAGEEVPAEQNLTLRLRLLEAGLELRVLARPLDGGALHAPGEGPPRLFASRGGRRVFVGRDVAAEEAHARALLAALPLGGAREEPPFQVTFEDDARALELVERLGSLDRPDVNVEWTGEPPRVLRAPGPRDLRVEVRDRHDWFGLSGEVEVDGERVALALVLDAVREGRRFVKVGPKAWLGVAGELADRLAPLARLSRAGKEGAEVGPAAFSALDDLERDGAGLEVSGAFAKLLSRMRSASREAPPVPPSFTATLRDYQVEGYRWLARLASWGAGACLADDMGLGKTLQALALLSSRAAAGPALVVAPTSVCANWVKEAARFAPALRVALYRESDREGVVASLAPGDVLVASYGLVTRDLERFKSARFATLVLDEAQAVKNAATRRARAVRELDAEFRVALTGTPIENHLGELWSLFRVAFPGLLGSWELFRERFALPIERDGDPAAKRALAATLRPFLLRRRKDEVARELPSRTEIALHVVLSAEERRLYDDARLAAVARLAGGDEARPEQRRFQVLAAITKLRLLACHPKLYDAASDLPSSKLARFRELAAELREAGHRALVFSQFTSHLALVRAALRSDGASFLYLDGQTPAAERDRLVERFQGGEGDLFLISLKAGGTGLNLTAADYVVHLDPWWNPAVEDQATDRAHRIGQTKPVTVYRLVAAGTIEEAIVALHAEKRDLVAGVLDGMDLAAKLSPEDLIGLIRAEPDESSDGGEPDEEADAAATAIAAEPVASLASATSPRSHSLPAATKELMAKFERHLHDEWRRGAIRTEGPVKTYLRAAGRFFEFVERERRRGIADGVFEEVVRRYLEALRDGSFVAPASELLVARTALRRLGALIAAERA